MGRYAGKVTTREVGRSWTVLAVSTRVEDTLGVTLQHCRMAEVSVDWSVCLSSLEAGNCSRVLAASAYLLQYKCIV